MTILDRYVMREFGKLFLLFVLAVPLLFILGDWTDNLDTFTQDGISTGRVALSYLYQLPQFVLYSLPIGALIATVFTVGNMTRHSEMAAAKAGGVSFYRVLRTLPLIGVALTLLGLGLSELVPVTERLRRQTLGKQESGSYARSDFVYAGSDGESYAIRRLDTEGGGVIRNMTVERPGDLAHAPSIYITSEEARFDTLSGSWRLLGGYYRILLDDTTDRTIQFGELRSRRFRETPEQLTARPKEPEEMRFAELGDYIEILERSGNEPLELMVERYQKLAIPLATLIIILFGAPLANSSSRGGPAYGMGISLGITIVYLMMFKVTEAAGATGALPIWAAAWLPNLVFAVAASLLLWRIRT